MKTMARHEWWREQYNRDPYLEVLEGDSLLGRTTDVINNLALINGDLKLSMLPVADEGEFWMISWTHLLEEWGKRGGIPMRDDTVRIPDLDWPGLESATLQFDSLKDSGCLLRFGKKEHIREAHERGRFRIAPASSYNDPSLNAAIRDDELELEVYRRSHLHGKLLDKHGRALTPRGPVHGWRKERIKIATNYLVLCLGLAPSLRMFPDFEADAVLVIKKPSLFVRKLGEAVRASLGTRWTWFSSPIAYIDPLRPPGNGIDLVRCKHFRYAYQKEYRICWVPPSVTWQLNELFVEVGSLMDCTEVVELNTGDVEAGASDGSNQRLEPTARSAPGSA